MNRTFFMCKPDAVERGLVGEIVGRIERRGLKIVAAELRVISEATARLHYAEHVEKGFFPELLAFITRGPSLPMVVEGPEDTWEIVREMMGSTNPRNAGTGTMRGDLATDMGENLVHGSDSAASARREIEIFFPNL